MHDAHGHPQEALPLYDQAGSLVNDSGDLLTQAMLLGGLAVSHSNMEDKEAAREFFKRPLDKVRALNDQIKVFICRGSSISEELADRTINRVAIKLPEIEGTYSGDPTAYFLSAAKFIYLESQRRERIPPDHYDVTLLDEELNQKLVIHGIATQHTATGKQLTVSVTGIYLPAGQLTMKATGV